MAIQSKLEKLLLNPPINLFKSSIWTFAIAFVLFLIAGLLGQMLLAVVFSVIASVSVFIAITQTKLFVILNNYLEAHLPARASRWVVVVIVIMGIIALIASLFVS